MIGRFRECSSPGRTTPGRVPPLWCGRAAALSVRKQKKKEAAQLTNKEGSVGDSIFSKWLIRMGRKAELTVGGRVGGVVGLWFFSQTYTGSGKDRSAAMRRDERWCCIGRRAAWKDASRCQMRLYICRRLCWNDGFIFMACLSVRDILQADTIRARCCGRGAGEVERRSSRHTACECLSCVCASLYGINTQTALVDSGLVQKFSLCYY